jgi:transposase-like protein
VPEVREQLRVWVREFEEEAGVGNPEPVFLKRVLADSPS